MGVKARGVDRQSQRWVRDTAPARWFCRTFVWASALGDAEGGGEGSVKTWHSVRLWCSIHPLIVLCRPLDLVRMGVDRASVLVARSKMSHAYQGVHKTL